MWNDLKRKKMKNRIKSISVAATLSAALLCGSEGLAPVSVWAGMANARNSISAAADEAALAAENEADTENAPFTLEEDTNTAGRKGLWKDIAPEGAVKGTNTYQIGVRWNEEAASRTLTFTSSDSSIATVSQSGLVTGKKEGHADITVSKGSYSQKFGINVRIPADEPYVIENGVLSYTSEKLGKKYRLAVHLPSDGSVVWNGPVSSGSEDISIISDGTGGQDYYLAAGKACTFRTTPESGKTSMFLLSPSDAGTAQARSDNQNSVTVTLSAPASLSISAVPTVYASGVTAPDDFVMKVGETVTLSPKITPDNATVIPSWKYKEQSDYWKDFIPGTTGFANAVEFDGTVAKAVRKGSADFIVSVPTGQTQTASDTLRITVVDQNTHLFDDVRKTESYYYNPVYWALEEKIAAGTTDTTFSPNATVTRGQIAMFLWKAAGSPEPETAGNSTLENPFTDVKPSGSFYKAILWAYQKGITSGTTATTFGPDLPCTRAQIVTFLYKYKGSPEVNREKIRKSFSDVKAGSYYENAVCYAVSGGITSGVSSDRFGPDETCTRGQAMTFLYRAQNGNA